MGSLQKSQIGCCNHPPSAIAHSHAMARHIHRLPGRSSSSGTGFISLAFNAPETLQASPQLELPPLASPMRSCACGVGFSSSVLVQWFLGEAGHFMLRIVARPAPY